MSAVLAVLLTLSVMPQPSANLGPEAVIRTVVEALRNYNSPAPNAGIFTIYQFASPANRVVVGPYGRFLRVVKSDDFTPLLHAVRAEMEGVQAEGDRALEVVRVYMADGRMLRYTFLVTRQRDGPCRGCWMIDGVGRVVTGGE